MLDPLLSNGQFYNSLLCVPAGDNINLFEGGDPRLTTCYKYVLDLLPGRSEESATICDYSFSLTFSANVDPAHLTVRFDNVYLVNQIMFDGYLPDVCKSPGDADRDNSPFCYKVREFYT